jgi:hypothetical protein
MSETFSKVALGTLEQVKDDKIGLHMIDLGGDVTGNGISKLVFTILSAVAENVRDRISNRSAPMLHWHLLPSESSRRTLWPLAKPSMSSLRFSIRRLVEIGLKAKTMGGWPMRKDRELIELAREGRSIDQIAARLEATPERVHKVAKRLGIKLGSVKDRRLKRKAK